MYNLAPIGPLPIRMQKDLAAKKRTAEEFAEAHTKKLSELLWFMRKTKNIPNWQKEYSPYMAPRLIQFELD